MTGCSIQQLSPSLEDYLEAAFWTAAVHGTARARDIAKAMHVRASSVTGALQALAQGRYINYTPYEAITLTAEGFDAALEIVRKHKILKDFFAGILGVNEAISEDIACKIEHSIPCCVAERIAQFASFMEAAPPGVQAWLDEFIEPCLEDSHSREADPYICVEKRHLQQRGPRQSQGYPDPC